MLEPELPIVTERRRLRAFQEIDLEALHAIQSLPEVVRYLYWQTRTPEQTRAALAERAARHTRITVEGDKLVLAVDRLDTGALVGDVNLVWTSREHRQGEIGFVLHPAHHGRGFAREAGAAMLPQIGRASCRERVCAYV